MTPDTRFIAFYSYKGGVGRSLALANLACLLAWKGRKVLILDLDLEAPGQHQTSLFRGSYLPDTPIRGILNLLTDFCTHRDAHRSEDPPPFQWDLRALIRRSTFFDGTGTQPSHHEPREPQGSDADNEGEPDEQPVPAGPSGSIWLMPAGTGPVDEDYQAALANWDWERFYVEGGEALLQELRWRLRGEGFDDVLIDSRTGLSDVFYVSTLSLADTVVCLTGLNNQNLEGTDLAVRTLRAAPNRERYGEKRILLVLSPLPHGFLSERHITRRLRLLHDRHPNLSNWVAELPYVPELSTEETVLVAESSDPWNSRQPYVQEIVRLFATIERGESSNPPDLREESLTNPFQRARIEYWPPAEIVNHFVDPGGNLMAHLAQFMPTVVYGSRGTGKTTLARWFSYETQVYLLERSGYVLGPSSIERIGLWFRLDIDLLNAFETSHPERQERFTLLFGQFFDLLIVRKALHALDALGGIAAWGDAERIFRVLSGEIGVQIPRFDLSHFMEAVEARLAEIRRYINNPLREPQPYAVQGNVLMKLLVEELIKVGRFGAAQYFSVFIDEYENFHPFQQRVVNTRVKQVKESDRVTYKLLARNQGIDFQTLARDQPIEITHDFRAYNLDEEITLTDFAKHVGQVICRHLEATPWFARRGLVDPDRLFPGLTPVEEAKRLADRRGNAPLLAFVEKEHGRETAERLRPWMTEEPNLLRQAVAVVLLNQGNPAESVLKEMIADSERARMWYHNYHTGALFWLGSLYRQRERQKLYTGMPHIVGVAGGNIRVALDLCHAILERWMAESPDHEAPIDPLVQSDAICRASEVYLRKLRTQAEPKIVRLVDRLGRLFEIIHKGPRQGEPEINHFVIGDEPEEEIQGLLRRCRAEGILRWLPGNKQKSRHDAHRDAWQLHPRYAPAFNISWRRKKRLDLSAKDLLALTAEDERPWKALVIRIEARNYKIGSARKVDDDRQGSLL